MAFYYDEPSHTFSEYLLIPGYTGPDCIPANVSLKTPLVKFRRGEEECPLTMNIPLVSAIMQAVSGERMAIALAREGGVTFIYGNQTPQAEANMVRAVKNHKAGFVPSDSNVTPDMTLEQVLELKEKSHHSTVAVTHDGSAHGRLLGMVTSRDYSLERIPLNATVASFMTPIDKLVVAQEGITLQDAYNLIWEHKLNTLPVVDQQGNFVAFVFRKDYDQHKENPLELLDAQHRFIVGAGVNTKDYETRIPLLVEAGADVLCIDSSEGFSEWQRRTIQFVRDRYGDAVKIGAGNVVDRDGFRFLAEAGADFVKIGIGGGSICITRETKGIGRGQATAVIEVAKARDEYFKETGVYVPICSDGGIVHDYHITLALAMGADFCMLGRYFARFDESPSDLVQINGNFMKEYWGEGSARAQNVARYGQGGHRKLSFVEGVDSYVPYAGPLHKNVQVTLAKIRHTLCNVGVLSIPELQQKAKLTLVSNVSIVEGGAHDVLVKDTLHHPQGL